ncbi:MAG: lysine--tRNA ligase [Salinirussus sp.]
MTDVPDPYAVASDPDRAFWADAAADAIEARDPEQPIVIKGGVSPSGVPHIGHANEILRGAFVADVLRERGYAVRQVFTADDRDRLRAIPRRLADLEGEIVGLDEVDAGALGRNLGRPYTDVPDPFGCCDSYGEHFTRVLSADADRLGIDLEIISNTELYTSGTFDPVVRTVLERADQVREILARHQASVDEDYIPFFAICESCGQLTETITSVDLDAGTVGYVCTDADAGDDVIEGCGHEGTTTLREGKLPWRVEWPAQWAVLDVDFEPFGKDHAEGSWPSGVELARRVLEIEPPVPMVYEWFTLEGEALSSSTGTLVTVDEVLDLVEPEVLKYFFAKPPLKQRDFSIRGIDTLVDEFDRFERIYRGEIRDVPPAEAERAERAYPLLVSEPDAERIRLPYTFAAVLGMTDDPTLREEIARREGHIPEGASEDVVAAALDRVERAQRWARRTDNAFNYELKRSELPDVDVDDATAAALDDVADVVASGADGETIQGAFYEAAKRHGLDVGDFFATGYRLFFDDDEGPQLGTFLGKLDRTFVVERLRRDR